MVCTLYFYSNIPVNWNWLTHYLVVVCVCVRVCVRVRVWPWHLLIELVCTQSTRIVIKQMDELAGKDEHSFIRGQSLIS